MNPGNQIYAKKAGIRRTNIELMNKQNILYTLRSKINHGRFVCKSISMYEFKFVLTTEYSDDYRCRTAYPEIWIYNNNKLTVITPKFNLDLTTTIIMDSQDNIYLILEFLECILKLDPLCEQSTRYELTHNHEQIKIGYLTIDSMDRIYITDIRKDRFGIRVYNTNFELLTIIATDTHYSQLAIDPNGYLMALSDTGLDIYWI